jgi:hypothetical protein
LVRQKVKIHLANRFPKDLVEALTDAFDEVQSNYRIEKWKPSELDAGHFVEAVRRLLEHELFGSYTPLAQSLGSFNQQVLNKLESASGDEVLRILIPRVLFSIYCIRNKRGVGHISSISPNKLDATYILNSAKWVLAELIRISVISTPDEAYELTNAILDRQIDLIWDDGESFMILDSKLKAEEKILLSLYKKDRVELDPLQEMIGYKNKTNFRKLAEKLKSKNLIDITSNKLCKLSPLGQREAERIIGNSS